MALDVFLDTSGFYALLVQRDDRHGAASRFMRRAAREKRRFVTTDYVLVESATLLKARSQIHLLELLFLAGLESASCRVAWTDADRFAGFREFFLKHRDQDWSFTDCASFCVMRESRLREALTKDTHFEEAGFVALLK